MAGTKNVVFKNTQAALAGVAQWTECWPVNQRSPVRFLIRTHTWIAGRVTSWGLARGNTSTYLSHMMFLPLSFSLPSPLSKNK